MAHISYVNSVRLSVSHDSVGLPIQTQAR